MTTSTNSKILTRTLSFLVILLFISISNIYSQDITPLDSLKMNDSDGISLWAGAPSINITGIVTSTIEPGTGTAGPGTIQNANTGVAVYGNFFASSSGVKIGDSVVVLDVKVSPYNGLTEIAYNSTSSVQIISSNHTVTPIEVTIANLSQGWNGFEKYESMFVKIKHVTFIGTDATFNLHTSTTGWNYSITDGKDTMTFRITKNITSILDQPVPSTPVDITGIISQYDSSAPYSSGYQIFPLGLSSISPATSVEENNSFLPTKFDLAQNYPNPFNPSTVIKYQVPQGSFVNISIYDILGNKISTLVNQEKAAGSYEIRFNASNLPSGIYFYTIQTGSFSQTKKMMLMK